MLFRSSRQDVSRECFSARSLRIDSERAQRLKRDDFQSALMRGLKNDVWSHVVLVGLLPARGAETPAVSGFETGETVFRHGGGKVVPSELDSSNANGDDTHHWLHARDKYPDHALRLPSQYFAKSLHCYSFAHLAS